MRTNKKLITTFTVFVLMLLTSFFCMNVFAAKTEKKEGKTTTTTAATTVAPVVSGCDLKKEDLQMAKVNMTDFSVLVPKGDVITAESESSVFDKAKMNYGFDRSTLFNENFFFYFNSNKENYCQVYAGFDEIKPLERYFRDYSRLTPEQQKEVIGQNVSADDDSINARFEKINGRTYLLISKNEVDTETGNKYVIYALYTVIGSYKYFIQIGVVNPNKNDLEVVNEMLNSVKLGGIKEPMSPLEIALIVCVVVLLVAVAFAYFMLYRLDRFAKCGITNVSVFGFNLPAPVSAEDDSDDDDSDDDVDDFEDDTAEDSYETAVLDSDEKIVDDESDSE